MVNIWSKIDTKRAHITCLLHVFLNDQCRIFIEVSCYIVTLPPRQNVPSEEFHSDDDPNSINNGANGESLPILVGELRINENTSMPSFSSTDVNNTETLTLTTRNRFMDNSQPTSSVYSHAAGENDEDGTTTPTEERALPNERRENTPRHEETEHPRHTLYADQSVRISYFLNWPSTITQAPNELADAGFFYSGNGDHTRCFFCGGGLRNWEPGDDPWVEHARWFMKCAFVRQNRGQDFIELVQRRAAELEEQRNQQATGNTQPNTGEESAQAKEEKVMRSPAVTTIKEMGYSEERIKAAINVIKSRLPRGKHKVSAHDILEVIFELNQSESSSVINQSETVTEMSAKNADQSNSVMENSAYYSGHSNMSEEGKLKAANDPDRSTEKEALEEAAGGNSTQNPIFDELTSLKMENTSLKDQILCKICMEKNVSIAFLPCGHLACCEDCSPAMRKCPICRQFVRGTVKTFLV